MLVYDNNLPQPCEKVSQAVWVANRPINISLLQENEFLTQRTCTTTGRL